MSEATEFKGVFLSDEAAHYQEEKEELIAKKSQQKSEKVDAFPDAWKEDFEGLTYLGYLEDVVEIPYHSFLIRTLTVGEKIEITRITKELVNVLGYNRAYKAAVVAAGLQTVDGKPLIAANKAKSVVRERYEYVVNAWYDPVIDLLYQAINNLELRALKVMYECGVVSLPPIAATQLNEAVEKITDTAPESEE